MLKPVSLWCAVLVALGGAVNFFWVLGAREKYGSALDGFVRNGHYYLALHGSYTEVSRAIWENIRLHELLRSLGGPFAIACLGYFVLAGAVPWLIGLRRGEAVIERVRAVRASGGMLARVRCRGTVAGVYLQYPALAIDLYPGGLTIRVMLEPKVAILKEELKRVEFSEGRFGRRVEITHRSPDIQSPLTLVISYTSDFAVAFEQFMESAKTQVK